MEPHLAKGEMGANPFLTGHEAESVKPVFGLTSSVLIKTTTVGYRRVPDFEVQPPNAPTPTQQIALALLTPSNPVRVACEQEGIDANEAAVRMLRPSVWEGVDWRKFVEANGGSEAWAKGSWKKYIRTGVRQDRGKVGELMGDGGRDHDPEPSSRRKRNAKL